MPKDRRISCILNFLTQSCQLIRSGSIEDGIAVGLVDSLNHVLLVEHFVGQRTAPRTTNYKRASHLAERGGQLTMIFCDQASLARCSHLHALKRLQSTKGAGKWLDDDVEFLSESIKGLLGIAGAQLLGLGRIISPGEPVRLHPLVTVLRGVAEACGTISWLVSPWLDAKEGF